MVLVKTHRGRRSALYAPLVHSHNLFFPCCIVMRLSLWSRPLHDLGLTPPSTLSRLLRRVQVLKHEYLNEPSLVGAGVFGLDDVFARLKPFVSRNLRPMPCPSLAPSAKRANNPEGRTTQSNSTGDRGPAEGAPSTSDGPSRGSTVGDSLRGTAGQRRRGCEWPRPVNAELPRSPRGEAFGQSLEGGEERRRRDELPALYFASVDIKHCYDTVDQVSRCVSFGSVGDVL